MRDGEAAFKENIVIVPNFYKKFLNRIICTSVVGGCVPSLPSNETIKVRCSAIEYDNNTIIGMKLFWPVANWIENYQLNVVNGKKGTRVRQL